jgi:hypothetical protein
MNKNCLNSEYDLVNRIRTVPAARPGGGKLS